uniref:Uncharacterized protein n=1 Tax=Anguilla anguilla TaxID=7936 RepID=A0A0E9RYC1_ANGAN
MDADGGVPTLSWLTIPQTLTYWLLDVSGKNRSSFTMGVTSNKGSIFKVSSIVNGSPRLLCDTSQLCKSPL